MLQAGGPAPFDIKDFRKTDLGLRFRTMNQRLTYLRPLFRWLEISQIEQEPTLWLDSVDELSCYLDVIAQGACEPSTIDSILLAIKYLERAGRGGRRQTREAQVIIVIICQVVRIYS